MFKALKITISFLTLTTTSFGFANSAAAFDSPGVNLIMSPPFCGGNLTANLNNSIATVFVSGGQNTGGSYWTVGSPSVITTTSPITPAQLESACNMTSVDIISQTGAGPGTYVNQSYMGIVFRGVDSGGNYHEYELAIVGQTSTTNHSRNTLLAGTPPTVVLSGAPDQFTDTTPFNVTAVFSESVSGLTDGDIVVANGSATVSGGPGIYTLTITPDGNGDVSIFVPAGSVVDDDDGYDNIASNTLSVRDNMASGGGDNVDETQHDISNFMLDRLNNLVSNQPGLMHFLQDNGCGSFQAHAVETAGLINSCVSQNGTWISLTSSWSDDVSYSIGTIGSHATINDNLLIGGMVQFDYATDNVADIAGRGWMVGPYFVSKAENQPLYTEGRLLYGGSVNDISPVGTYTDEFKTERWLLQLRTTGEYFYNETTLMPHLDLTYSEDHQRAYTDGQGNAISAQSVSLGQFSAGVDFRTPLSVQNGALELIGGLAAIYSSVDGNQDTAVISAYRGGRGRADLGLNYNWTEGGILRVSTFYDGIGAEGYKAYGAELILEFVY